MCNNKFLKLYNELKLLTVLSQYYKWRNCWPWPKCPPRKCMWARSHMAKNTKNSRGKKRVCEQSVVRQWQHHTGSIYVRVSEAAGCTFCMSMCFTFQFGRLVRDMQSRMYISSIIRITEWLGVAEFVACVRLHLLNAT